MSFIGSPPGPPQGLIEPLPVRSSTGLATSNSPGGELRPSSCLVPAPYAPTRFKPQKTKSALEMCYSSTWISFYSGLLRSPNRPATAAALCDFTGVAANKVAPLAPAANCGGPGNNFSAKGDNFLNFVVRIELGHPSLRRRVTSLALSVAGWVHISTMATFPPL